MNAKGNKYFILLVIVGTSLFSACKKTKSVSSIPEISYNSFTKYGKDSALISINFKDGDGDIGLNQPDTASPFNSKSPYYNNLFMVYYYKGSDGNFHRYFEVLINDSIDFRYRVPNITPKGKNKSLEGEIKVVLKPVYYAIAASPAHTLIRYQIYIYDRALNKSNVIVSDDISIP